MDAKRTFLHQVLAAGLEGGVISADDVIVHVTPQVIAEHLPADAKAELIQASLASAKLTPALIVETLRPERIAEHVPMAITWACISDVAARGLDQTSVSMPAASQAAQVKASKPAPVAATKAAKEPERLPEPPAPPLGSGDETREVAIGGNGARDTAKIPTITPPKSTTPQPKPNVRAKAPKPRPGARSRGETDFDVDTDIGETWDADAVVEEFEIVEEAEALGPPPGEIGDWKTEEDTRDGAISPKRKR